MARPTLTRSRDDRVLSGVAAGLATHLGVEPGLVRAGFVVTALLGGVGALFYAWLWALVPTDEPAGDDAAPLKRVLTAAGPSAPGQSAPGPSAPVRRRRLPVAEFLLGSSLLFVGVTLVLDRIGWHLPLDIVLPALAVLVGLGLAWWQIADRDRPERHQLPRVLGALALVAVGALMFFVAAGEPNAWTVIAAAFAVLAGVSLALAPWLLRLNRDLIDERSARARETARSEMAAHLHDSVLQTLALIQQRAEPGSDVDRLARGQERELREWLFRGAGGGSPAAGLPLHQALRVHAADLERDHAVRFEIVSVGEEAHAEDVPQELAAAAKEAMLNAAQHAGGPVTVYIEVGSSGATVDVLDRGPGFDLDALPAERMGVRESILGRMERVQGTARIGAGPGGRGTSVRLATRRTSASPAGASTTDQSGAEHPGAEPLSTAQSGTETSST